MLFLISCMFGIMFLSSPARADHSSEEEVACATCTHMTFELRNLPAIYRMIFDQIFSNLSIDDPDCVSNTKQPQTCPAPMFPNWMENRCLSTHVTVHAVGITGFLPDAEMDVVVVTRECHSQWRSEMTGCQDIASLDEETQAQIVQQLADARNSWDTVTYTGEVCIL